MEGGCLGGGYILIPSDLFKLKVWYIIGREEGRNGD